jgi:choline dehydrogenase-like flavoprotein
MAPFIDDADVVIVGSGPTGATYARVLCDARPDTRVLMVEAGPIVAHPPGLHVSNIIDPVERAWAQTASQGPYQFRYELPATSGTASNVRGEERQRALVTRPGLFAVGSGDIQGDGFPAAQEACNVGGMGSHWFGCCPRPSELEIIDFIDPETLESAYVLAERLVQVSNTQFRASRFAKHVEKVLGEDLNEGRTPDRYVQPMPMAVTLTPHGVQRTGPNVILDYLPADESSNFELRPETLCERLILVGGRATGVLLRDRKNGAVTTVSAKYVVIAADSLRTPQLLFASGVRPEALGHYLNEHPQVSILAEVHGLGSDHVLESERESAMAVACSGVTWIPYEGADFPFSGMLVQIDRNVVPRSNEDRRNPLISVHLFASAELRYENRLEFSETETDWIGMPAMKIRYALSGRDLKTLERGKVEVLRLSHILGKPVAGEAPWVLPLGSSLHYQGTVRMGQANDGASVCDPTSRVWDTENVYVAGNGVIPTETACNPTLTSMALSVIGANDIVSRLGTDKKRPGRRERCIAPASFDCESVSGSEAVGHESKANRRGDSGLRNER